MCAANRGRPERCQTPVKLATLELEITADAWTVVPRRQFNDLAPELRGDKAAFSNDKYEHGYWVEVGPNRTAVEYINYKWYYLTFDQHTGTYLTKETLALTNNQLLGHGLACERPPPPSNLLTPREPTPVVPDDDADTPVVQRVSKETGSDDEDLYEPARGLPQTPQAREPIRNPIPPEEEAFLSASLEHVVTLEHANHPEEPVTHLRPHLTNIQLALQTGNPVPHYPPHMAELEEVQAHEREEINVTRTQPEPAPAVRPGNDEEGNGKGGRALVSPPEAFKGERDKADDFLQDFDLCWRLNRQHPAMRRPYDRVMLALSYMRGSTTIRNWVKAEMKKIDELTSVSRHHPVPYESERLWMEFRADFENAFTNTTKVQDAEAALEQIHINREESIDEYISRFEDLMQKAGWGEYDRGTINTFRRGLHDAMQKAIFLKDPIPVSFEGWKEAARKEASRYALMKSAGMFQKRDQKTGGFKFQNPKAQQRWGKFAQSNQSANTKRDPNAMDVDTIRVNQLTAEEKQKCMKEGRCFRCQNTGHRSKECPTKKANNATAQFAAQTQRAAVRTSEVVDDRDADDTKSEATAFSKAETIRNLKALKEEERLQLIDELFAEQQTDF